MSHPEAVAQYAAALKRGQRYYKNALAKGSYPYPQVLDELVDESMSAGRFEVGLVDIPAELIVGTRTAGRRAAFAGNFMPLLPDHTEFGVKWIALCEAHLGDEGIRDPIRCYEYLGRFYVSEGNKRVSVLKSYDAATIPGYVTRILPVYSEDPAIRLYDEFLRFYPCFGLYQIRFSQLGSCEKLQKVLGFEREHVWTMEEKRAFLALLSRFSSVCAKRSGPLPGTVCDALLVCLQVFPFAELKAQTAEELGKTLDAMWADIKAAAQPSPIAVSTEPSEEDKSLLSRIKGIARPDRLQIAFVYAYDPQVSAWTRAHIQGENALTQELGARISVKKYWALQHDYEAVMEQAVEEGADLIFATTPQMILACRKIAALHPAVRVLDCALSKPYTGLRTYYSRTYEAKFITGAIAGAMAEKDRIGYIAGYPIVGTPADINAFALGAQMTNPRVRIDLLWSAETEDPLLELMQRGVTVISNRDASSPKLARWAMEWGTYQLREDGGTLPLALPCWDWGRFYVQVVQSIFNGSYDALAKSQSDQAINYWWGMSSGMIDVKLSSQLPEGLRRLSEHLCQDLRGGWFDPFRFRILDQSGVERNDGSRGFMPEEILRMDWLCENVDGAIPPIQALRPEAMETTAVLAIHPE